MDYSSLIDPIQWQPVVLSVLQTAVMYGMLLLGLRVIGRRVLGEVGPQDLITLILIAEAASYGLPHADGGFWGAVASVLTILVMGWMNVKIPALRRFWDSHPVVLYKNGQIEQQTLDHYFLDKADLEQLARQYGMPSYRCFDTITLENNGSLTGTLGTTWRRPPHRPQDNRHLLR